MITSIPRIVWVISLSKDHFTNILMSQTLFSFSYLI